jgi:hypothetical protein
MQCSVSSSFGRSTSQQSPSSASEAVVRSEAEGSGASVDFLNFESRS